MSEMKISGKMSRAETVIRNTVTRHRSEWCRGHGWSAVSKGCCKEATFRTRCPFRQRSRTHITRTTSQNDSTPIATIRGRRASSTASSSPATAKRVGIGENGGGNGGVGGVGGGQGDGGEGGAEGSEGGGGEGDGEGGEGEGGEGVGGGPAHSLALGTSEAATLRNMGQGHSSPYAEQRSMREVTTSPL